MSLRSQVESVLTVVATDWKNIQTKFGDLSTLTTTNKASIVAAINEVKATAASASVPDASDTVKGKVELATSAETITGTDATLATTPAGVKAKVDAAIAALVNGAPGALDALNELAAALGNDPNFATTVNASIAAKQPLDSDLTAIAALVSAANKLPYATGTGTWALTDLTAAARTLLDDADVATMRGTLSVYSQSEIGDLTTMDLPATYAAAKV